MTTNKPRAPPRSAAKASVQKAVVELVEPTEARRPQPPAMAIQEVETAARVNPAQARVQVAQSRAAPAAYRAQARDPKAELVAALPT